MLNRRALTIGLVLLAATQAMTDTAWLEIVLYVVTTVVGVWVNYLLVTARVRRNMNEQSAVYRDRVDRLTWEVNSYESKVEELRKEVGTLGRAIAAISGKANGTTYHEGD